jgi:ribosomal-protein-alanine N-acetyltransferase
MPPVWPLVLSDAELTLRPLRRRDRRAFETLLVRNREWLSPWDATDPERRRPRPTNGELLRWSEREGRAGRHLSLLLCADGRPAGQVSAGPILYGAQSSATIGYWIDHARAGRGYAPRGVALLIDHLFAEVGLHRVEINIRPENEASLRVARKLHLREEGLRERFIHVDGAFRDHLSFALTADEVETDERGRGVLARYRREHMGATGAS